MPISVISLLGLLFRGQRNGSRKTNMLIFLTPHIVDTPEDLEEVTESSGPSVRSTSSATTART